jgi:hypothetical protein
MNPNYPRKTSLQIAESRQHERNMAHIISLLETASIDKDEGFTAMVCINDWYAATGTANTAMIPEHLRARKGKRNGA